MNYQREKGQVNERYCNGGDRLTEKEWQIILNLFNRKMYISLYIFTNVLVNTRITFV
ncbi:hypothetical protein [Nostoc sp.]|uniref:hypothetical protein n=1 Tax=Nostoc sp. TaxID=1180 RepID=UPI002FF5E3A7